MNDPNLHLLEAAVKLLRPLLDELVFVGGCATGLLITDQAAVGIRPTKDVDTITEVGSYAEYAKLSERLRAVGLTEDHEEGAPICRWKRGDLIIDVMPTDERILGFSNRWYAPALESAQYMEIAGLGLRVVTAVHFLAMKLEAFHGRGKDDVMVSHDLEDLVTVIDGRHEIFAELRGAAPAVRLYIASQLRQLLARRAFIDALPGFLLPDSASQGRSLLLLDRLAAMAALE